MSDAGSFRWMIGSGKDLIRMVSMSFFSSPYIAVDPEMLPVCH